MIERALQALTTLKFWDGWSEVSFVLGGEEGRIVYLRSEVPEGAGPRSRHFLVAHGLDLLMLPWLSKGGLLNDATNDTVFAIGLPVFEDTRERLDNANVAVFRFARCPRDAFGHAGGMLPRVLCEECVRPLRTAYAEGLEASRAREAVSLLREMSEQEARRRR